MRNRRAAERTLAPRDSGTWFDVDGIVVRLLPDDHDGSRHQRFVLDIGAGRTLLVAHNIDLVARLPLGLGDRVALRGMYEWNDLGGLVHWTHADPMGIEDGGYVRFRGTTYR